MAFRPSIAPERLALAALLGVTAGAAVLTSLAKANSQEIGVYSGRHYNTDKALYKQFTKKTGIKVKLLEAKDDALIERIKREGANSPADVLVLADAARLDKAADAGLFRPSRSAALNRDVPANLRDSKGLWFGLTRWVRVVVVNPKAVNPSSIRSYADLANPSLKGQLCLRNRKSVYNQSLVADQMILRGDKAASAWVKGMLAGSNGASDQRLANQVKVRFPDPAHVNITGAGVVKTAKNPEAALRLIEFLASPSGGRGYAEANNEYPLRGFGDNAVLKRWGTFKADGVSAQQMGAKNKAAVALMRAGGWR